MLDVVLRPTAFLDRDGTINVKAPEGEYITAPSQVRLLPGAADAIRRLNDRGALVVIVTNQRGVALGRMTQQDVDAVNARLTALLATAAGAAVDDVLICPHDVGQCNCRKPAPGLLTRAYRAHRDIDLKHSILIGDSDSDVEAAHRFGVPALQLGADAADLYGAVERAIGDGRLG